MKTMIAAGLMILIAAAAFASGTQQAATAAGEVSVMVYERGWVATDIGTVTDNPWTRWIAEQSGVNVRWVAVPRGEVTATLNTMFAAGTAPDLIQDFPRSTVANFRAQGVLQPVNDVIEQYSTAYRQYLVDNPEIIPYVTFDDGQMWAFSSIRPVDSIANHTMWVRKDWMDNLGLSVPDTDQEFFAMADAFVTGDPNRTGQRDTFAFAALPAYFPIIDQLHFTNNWYVENGRLEHSLFTDRYAAMLAFHKRAYDNGWLDPEYITDRDRTRQTQLWVTGRAGIAFAGINPADIQQLLANVPSAEIMPIRPFQTRFGRNGLLEESLAHRFIGMNAEIRHPDQAMKLLDWMIDTGWYELYYGLEGRDHELVDGVIPRQIVDSDTWTRNNRYAVDLMLLDQRYMEPSWIPVMAAPDDMSQLAARLKAQALEVSMMDDFRRDLPYEPTADDISQFWAEFGPIQNQIVDQTIIGGPSASVQDAVARLRSEWRRLGGDNVTRIYNEWFQANRSALGH